LENRKPEISFQPDAIYTAIEASGINLRTANENWFNLGPIDNDRPHPHSCANTHTLAGTQIRRSFQLQLQLQHNVALALKSRYVKLQLRLGWACFGFSTRFRDTLDPTKDREGGHRDGGP